MNRPELDMVVEGMADLDNETAFHDAVRAVACIHGLSAADFSKALPVDTTTAQRWIDRLACPRPLMRKPVYRFLESVVLASASQAEKERNG